jgi:hypothetical protein
VFGVDETFVVVELNRLGGDIEREAAIGTLVVFPAAMRLLKKIVSEVGGGFGEGRSHVLWFGLSPLGVGHVDLGFETWDGYVSGLELDLLDLAGIAIAIEIDEYVRDAGGSEHLEQCSFIAWAQLGAQSIMGRVLCLPIGIGDFDHERRVVDICHRILLK